MELATLVSLEWTLALERVRVRPSPAEERRALDAYRKEVRRRDLEAKAAEGGAADAEDDDGASRTTGSVGEERAEVPSWEDDKWDASREEEARRILAATNDRPVSEHWRSVYRDEAQRFWDLFYKTNETHFYKDRHYLHYEFAKEIMPAEVRRVDLLEFGCGVGNALLPLVERFPHMHVHAFDLSARAIGFLRENPLYRSSNRIRAFVSDACNEPLPEEIDPRSPRADPWVRSQGGFDVVLMLHMLAACAPDQFETVVRKAFDALRPGGTFIFRDHGRYDAAQLRFKTGHMIAENFYVRQDGTQVYYFSLDDVRTLVETVGFEVSELEYTFRIIRNRKTGMEMRRIFVLGRFRKPELMPLVVRVPLPSGGARLATFPELHR